MQNSFDQFNEILERLEFISEQKNEMPQIEKDIVLEKLRKIYVNVLGIQNTQTTENHEVTIVNQESEKEPGKNVKPLSQEKHNFATEKGLEDDVDLFFDTDHESYNKEIPEIQNIDIEEPVADKEEVAEEPVQQPEVMVEETKVEEVVAPTIQAEPEPKVKDASEDLFANDEDDLLQFIPQPAPQKEVKPIAEAPKPVVETPAPKPQPVVEKPVEKPIENKPQRSLNDLFNEQKEDRSLSAQFQHAKVEDLTKAISINDKFIFIKELFNNRGEDFSVAIHDLNQCKDLEAAFDCLENYKKKHFWDTTSTAYLSLCDLLRRKFL